MKVNIMENRMAMRIICEAVRDNFKLIDQMNHTQDGVHEIKFTVDGVELNFVNFINSIENLWDEAITKAAGKMYLEKCDNRIEEIECELQKIAERLKALRVMKFPEIDWPDYI
jgi:hypothetical protein